ncbi:MAG: alpha/beta fold hydrolase [Pirellulaceae bacterium]|nr:alpha/beta fold hydrolase [Pirellulaceae bacterium]
MQVEKVRWGGLDAIVAHGLPPDTRPELAVVLCHGFGASGLDLAGLTQAFAVIRPELLSRVAFIYPAAPLDLASHGIPGGRAWWLIDLDRLLNRPTPELLAQFRRGCPAGLPEARVLLQGLLDAASLHFEIGLGRIVLGGFSQGSMLATDVALRSAVPLAGLCILSGALVNEDEWRALSPPLPLAVFQSHGRQDGILMYPQATALQELLVEKGADVEFMPFPGQHEIPPVVVHRLVAWLEKLLGPLANRA